MVCEALLVAWGLSFFSLLVIAMVILGVLLCSTHRKNLCLEFCGGRPGLYSPVDLLHRGPHRLIYAVIFGAMSDQFLALAFSGASGICSISNPYGQAFCNVVLSKALLVLILCLLYGPLFACVNVPSRPLLGHITGLTYLILLIITFEILHSLEYSGCYGVAYDGGKTAIDILGFLPSYIFYIILVVWFIYEIVNDIVIKCRGTGIIFTHRKNAYLFRYTRHLLKNKEEPHAKGRWQQFKSFFWVYEKNFRFPLRFLAPLIVMASINFKLFFFCLDYVYLASALLDNYDLGYYDVTRAMLAVLVLSGLMAVVLSGILLFQLTATVHKHLKLAAQGKFKFYRKSLPSHSALLVSALKYGGYQIGYFVWAWLIFWVLGVVCGELVVALFFGLVYFPDTVGPRVFLYATTVVWLPIVLLVHRLMCKFVFLESDSGGKFLAITNRNGFNWFSYFVFLYNAIVGFVAAIIRVLLSLLFGTLLLFRLDQNIMMDGFKFADKGNKVYKGFLYLEHTYNNPVANTFVALLTDGSDQEGEKSKLYKGGSVRNRKARNRWLVAYTLVHNPSLRPLRASQLISGCGQEEAAKGAEKAVNEYEI